MYQFNGHTTPRWPSWDIHDDKEENMSKIFWWKCSTSNPSLCCTIIWRFHINVNQFAAIIRCWVWYNGTASQYHTLNVIQTCELSWSYRQSSGFCPHPPPPPHTHLVSYANLPVSTFLNIAKAVRTRLSWVNIAIHYRVVQKIVKISCGL